MSLTVPVISSSSADNAKYTNLTAQNHELTAQNHELTAQQTILERRVGNLTGERDSLDWTVGVMLDFDNFPVSTYCPQKGEKLIVYSTLQ